MRYWYGYTGEALLLGYGRAIRGTVDRKDVAALKEKAMADYTRYAPRSPFIQQESYVAALIAAYAMQQLEAQAVQAYSFSSVAEASRIVGGPKIEQVAANLWNGMTVSGYAEKEAAIAQRVLTAFQRHELLTLPRDAEQLHAAGIVNELPGMVSHLLLRSNAERKAFAAYLRRGTSPTVTTSRFLHMTKSRTVPRTWEREAHIEQKDHACEQC